MSITEIPGVRVGHWTDDVASTGCTVVLFPDGTVASGEVRGGAPATREWELLSPERMVARIDAVVLSGGSAFGLAACDGVVRFCEERGMGYPTAAGPVPIVVGASLFDLLTGDGTVRPTAANGYDACVAATAGAVGHGPVGAATGATVAKWRGREHARPGGIGCGVARRGDAVVAALLAVNAFGDRLPASGRPAVEDLTMAGPGPFEDETGTNTTIGVVATNVTLDKTGCLLVARAGHDGLARALWPVHTTVDGDALVAASVGGQIAPVDVVAALANEAVALAVENALSGA